MSTAPSYKSNWRVAENDATPYAEDFTEWLTLLVEVLNGHKRASDISLSFILQEGGTFDFTYTDNGRGCTTEEAEERLLTWASTKAGEGHSVYGHGTKKFLAKSGSYDDLRFAIRTATADQAGIIREYSGPYKGLKTPKKNYLASTRPDFPSTGFEIELTGLDADKLGKYKNVAALKTALKEIVCTRKAQDVLDRINYSIHITEVRGEGGVGESETNKETEWLSFFETLHRDSRVKKRLHQKIEIVPGRVELEFFSLQVPQHTHDKAFHADLKAKFPTYGKFSGGAAARIHCFNEDTMIEAIPYSRLYGKAVHSTMYHNVEFAFFRNIADQKDHNDLPQPASTKVQYRYETPLWKEFVEKVKGFHGQMKKVVDPAPTTLGGGPVVLGTVTGVDPAGIFASLELNKRANYLVEHEEAAPTRFEPPTWIQFPELLVRSGPAGRWQLECIKERVRGELVDDFTKGHAALCAFANQHDIPAMQISLSILLKPKNDVAKRLAEYAAAKQTLSLSAYPFLSSITVDHYRAPAEET